MSKQRKQPSRHHRESSLGAASPCEAESPHDSKIALPSQASAFALGAPYTRCGRSPAVRTASEIYHLRRGQQSSRRTVARHLELAPAPETLQRHSKQKKQDGPHAPARRASPLKSTATVMRTASGSRAKAHESFSAERKAMSVKIKNVFGKQIMGGVFAKSPSSYEGVLYKSRVTAIKPEEVEDHWDTGSDHSGDVLERPSHLGDVDDERPPSTAGGLPADMADDVSSADERPEDMTQRQQLAVTLRNYCKKENNVKHLRTKVRLWPCVALLA